MAVRDFSAHGTTRVAKVAEGVEVCVLHVRGRKTVDRIRSADLRTLRGKDRCTSARSSDQWDCRRGILFKKSPRKRQSCQSGRGDGRLCFARAGTQDWGGANPKRRSEDSEGWRSVLLAEI